MWSDYPEEREYFFIGGLQRFHFVAIHNVVEQADYGPFVEAMDILREMVSGWHIRQKEITKTNVQVLLSLIISLSVNS